MKRYDKYKPTGLPWVGEVPEHWEVKKMKYTANLYNGDSLNDSQKKEYFDCHETNSLPYIASKDIDRDTEFVDYDNGMRIPNNGKGFSIANSNTTLLCIEGGSAGKKIAFTNQPVCFVNKLCCFDSKLNNKFNYYFTCSNSFKEPFFQNLQGMIGGVTIGQIKNFPITIPPVVEQEAIANYLDEKCGGIDKIIATQEKRVALLNELKQSVISEAVTRGINPDAPLIATGIEWIGEIPEHWEVKRLRFVCEFRNGYTPSKANPDFWEDGTIPWYRMEDIRDSGRFLNEAKQYVTEEAVKGAGLFEAESFILATTATIGEHAMLIVDSLANQRFTNLKIRKSLAQALNKDFFFYYLYVVDDFCKSSTRTATFPAMNMEDLKNFGVTLPPIKEQEKIVEYLNAKTTSIDTLISKANKEIELLNEYKQLIITEAVTGKIKVC